MATDREIATPEGIGWSGVSGAGSELPGSPRELAVLSTPPDLVACLSGFFFPVCL